MAAFPFSRLSPNALRVWPHSDLVGVLRLEIDYGGGHRATQGSASSPSTLMRGVLYRGGAATPSARFDYHLQSRAVPRFVHQVVESLKAGGYL